MPLPLCIYTSASHILAPVLFFMNCVPALMPLQSVPRRAGRRVGAISALVSCTAPAAAHRPVLGARLSRVGTHLWL